MAQMQWSREEYILRDFEYTYGNSLPCMLEVTQGYCGYGEDFLTFSTNEVYRVDRLASQSRIVARADTGVLYSIPVASHLKFKIAKTTTWGKLINKAMYLDEILSKCEFDETNPLTLVPEHGENISFWEGADRRSTVHFGKLQIISTYDDKYLVVNPYVDGHLWDGLILPLFVSIKVRVAEGFMGGGRKALNQFIKSIGTDVGTKNEKIAGNKEIMIFDSGAATDGVYDYLEPSTYVSCSQASHLRSNVVYESPRRRSEDKYQYTPLQKSAGAHQGKEQQEIYSEVQFEPTIPEGLYEGVAKTAPVSKSVKDIASKLNQQHVVGGKHQATEKSVKESYRPPVSSKPRPHGSNRNRELPDVPMHSQARPEERHRKGTQHTPVIAVKPVSKQGQGEGRGGVTGSEQHHSHSEAAQQGSKKEKIYVTYADVPKSVSRMSIREVADCLRLLGLEKYTEAFKANDVDGALLLELDSDVLTTEFGLTKFEAIKVVKFAKSGWRPTN